MKNYYEILQVDKKATFEIINRVYKYHVKKNHPDLFKGKEKIEAKERIQEFNEAYEILSNKEKREEYDKNLEEIQEKEKIEIIQKLEVENDRLQNQLLYKDKLLKDILIELNIPYTNQMKEFLNEEERKNSYTYSNNFDNNINSINTSKRYFEYTKITLFKILILITLCILLTFALSKLNGDNYIDLFQMLFLNKK